MDREIKFRGKVIKGYQENFFKQKFVYGNVIYCEDDIHSTIINDEFEATVDTDSVGQFTGFYDINDVEIYEGDIVTNKRGNYKYYITFENGSFVCYHLNMVDQVNGGNMRWGLLSRSFELEDEFQLEIIGNIYETPEL